MRSASPYSLVKHEAHFLARVRHKLENSLAFPDRLIDYLKASDLLSSYLYMRGRFLEGSPIWKPNQSPDLAGQISLLEPPKSQIELADRIFTFWKLYIWDKAGVILTGFVSALNEIPDGIITPLPRRMSEYELGIVREEDCETIQQALDNTCLDHGSPHPTDSQFTIVLKSLALFERAKMVAMPPASPNAPRFEADCIKALEKVIIVFAERLYIYLQLPPTELPETPKFHVRTLSWTLALGSILQITQITAVDNDESYAERVKAARRMAATVPRVTQEAEIRGCLTFGYCWGLAAEALFGHLRRLKTHDPSPIEEISQTQAEAETLLFAVDVLSKEFTMLGASELVGNAIEHVGTREDPREAELNVQALQRQIMRLEAKHTRLLKTLPRDPPPVPDFRHEPSPLKDYGERPPEMKGRWWEPKVLAVPVRDYLLNICLMTRHRHFFCFHLPSFFASLSSTDPLTQPHPVLLESMYLIACYFTDHLPTDSPYSLVKHEAHFLERARVGLDECLAYSDRLMDYLKASVILTTYMYTRGRLIEGYHHVSSAARLAVSCGLHRIQSPVFQPNVPQPRGSSSHITLLDPPRSQMELFDRISTFWLIYCWEKFGVGIGGFVAALLNDEIITPLPRATEEYESGDLRREDCETLQEVLERDYRQPDTVRRRTSRFGWAVKSMAFLERAKMVWLAAKCEKKPKYSDEIVKRLEGTIIAFAEHFHDIMQTPWTESSCLPTFDPLPLAYIWTLTATLLITEACTEAAVKEE
ncbi:hypothetical protein FRB99_002809 [Tulasnella sp. 403]|nr:hypothetical protein FRB99_002809 [Tulasnella sp. 403]